MTDFILVATTQSNSYEVSNCHYKYELYFKYIRISRNESGMLKSSNIGLKSYFFN